MSPDGQKTIESFFEEYGITDPDEKAKLLPEVTDIIYKYNMAVVRFEQEADKYKKGQAEVGVKEWKDKIDEVFKDFKKAKGA